MHPVSNVVYLFGGSMKKTLFSAVIASACSISAHALPTVEEMWKVIQQQQAEIERLKQQQNSTDSKLELTEQKVEATAEVLDSQGTSLNKAAHWVNNTRIGGYGELHYNKLNDENGDADKDEVDLHRFVLFFGHQFNDSVRFFSELEIEHSLAGEGKKGEVEMEQAYVEWDYATNHRAKAGVFLIPVGILNETHEPETFYGVERNSVEKNIIPATWWEGGVASSGELAPGWSYDVAVHSGLYLSNSAAIRKGRQKVSNAKADDYAYTGRLKYTGVAGLELAVTLQHQTDLFQSETINGASDVSAWLHELHVVYQQDQFALRALYASWDIDSGINALADGADEQRGFFIEPSYKFNPKVGVFARYSEWDNTAGSSNDSEYSQFDIGLNYWLTPNVVFKADYQDQDAPDTKAELDGINLGVGWSF